MQKVLYVIDTLQTGGAERSTLEIASRLQHHQAVVCQVYQKDELSAEFSGSGILFEKLGISGKYEFGKAVSLLRAVIKKHQPVLIIGTLMRAELIARVAAKLEKVPILGTFVNDTYAGEALNNISKGLLVKIRFFQFWNAFTAKFCAAFIANSEAIKLSNAKALNIAPGKIIVIHRGRKTALFTGQKMSASHSNLHFINVGRLLERKGQLELIEAFSRFNQQYPNSTLTIAGEGPFRPTLEAAIERLAMQEKIKLAGNTKDIASFLRSGDCFIFPSHYEGFSGALVEAALSGTPIIASNISMNKEVIPTNGAYFFEVKNIDSMVEKMLEFASNIETANAQANRSRQYAIEHFDIDKIVAEHEATYKKFGKEKHLQPA